MVATESKVEEKFDAEDSLCETLGFRVKDGQIQTHAKVKNTLNLMVPVGVRPATMQEQRMWDALIHGW